MAKQSRLEVWKTYKNYVGGQFPRTESGRSYAVKNAMGKTIANACQSSRKDVRDGISAARSAWSGWNNRSGFNRGQILYRIAEMLEGRKKQLSDLLVSQGYTAAAANREINRSVDRLIYYAGWCDKYQSLFSTVNPVASAHYNFSVPESMGVVGMLAPANASLLGVVSLIAPCIAGGNTCLILADQEKPLAAISFAEVLHSADVPGGVVNILTGYQQELIDWISSHVDVNAVVCFDQEKADWQKIQENGAGHIKRTFQWNAKQMDTADGQSPYFIMDLQEVKTTWHPIQTIVSKGGAY
ncbi:MAG: aldehyde dehydrogenase [Bacteroidetes bacterium]|nr:aldehyde dehydrogenase [Bacteroidota bacterium]